MKTSESIKFEIEIRECVSVKDLNECVELQRAIFALPEIELSPLRHFVVTKNAGGFTLGAFAENKLVGFVLSVPAFFGNERFFYSHMAAVKREFQSAGIGAKLKWAQRETALAKGVDFIKWTFQPIQARNAFFNLNKLGAVVRSYEPNFYGTDYGNSNGQTKEIKIDSDRLFAEWFLASEKVKRLAKGEQFEEKGQIVKTIKISPNWNDLLKNAPGDAAAEQSRIKDDFQKAFSENLICRGFERDENAPRYLLYNS